jgi:hypothetical protein
MLAPHPIFELQKDDDVYDYVMFGWSNEYGYTWHRIYKREGMGFYSAYSRVHPSHYYTSEEWNTNNLEANNTGERNWANTLNITSARNDKHVR